MTILLFLNVLYLNFVLTNKQAGANIVTDKQETPIILFSPTNKPTLVAPTVTQAVVLPTVIKQQPVVQQSVVKDYFIPLGSGTSQTTEWADVPGVQAVVDFGQYQNIKEVRFEASIYFPATAQIALVRLFNVTDKHPVWYSEASTGSNNPSYLISSPLVYDTGLKTYQVQMKTQLQAPANLVQSRIHIILR